MSIFNELSTSLHEQVVFCHNKKAGLKAIIGIHSTVLGPALGGARLWPYKEEAQAIHDVLRLSRGMTYKNAAAGLALGGGKAVIIASPEMKNKHLLHAYAEMVHTLGGRYITAPDVNTAEEDMVIIREKTPFVTSLPVEHGGSGDPSPFTALGTFEGIKASVTFKLGKNSLEGACVAVQGLGHVGFALCKLLHEAGAKLVVSDMEPERTAQAVRLFSAKPVGPNEIYAAKVDVFAPCALGAVLNDTTIPNLQCHIVAGAANNQLAVEEKHGQMLEARGILYAPDFIINAGGVINISFEIGKKYEAQAAAHKVREIYNTLTRVYRLAEEFNIPTYLAAIRLAEKALEG